MRTDPLLLLTFLGLIGSAALATLHPPEPFDPDAGQRQAGRQVQVRLLVTHADMQDTWGKGQATAPDKPGTGVPWLWFRPPEPPPLPGDLLDGNALVQREGNGVILVLDGPHAARVHVGPHPVPVRWDDLVAHPEHYAARALVVNGNASATHVHAAGDASACARPEVGLPHPGPTLVIELERTADLAWRCRVVDAS